MKPYIVYIKDNGKIELTKEELDKMITDAYEKGRLDAPVAERWYPYHPYPYDPYYTYTTSSETTTNVGDFDWGPSCKNTYENNNTKI